MAERSVMLVAAYLLIGLSAAVWVAGLRLDTGEPPGMEPILFLMILFNWGLYVLVFPVGWALEGLRCIATSEKEN